MVWDMKFDPRRHEIGLAGIPCIVLALVMLPGCGSGNSKVTMAPPSTHELSVAQEDSMMAILKEVAMASPPGDESLQLLPPTGIRWSDNSMAMDKAAGENSLAVLRMEEVDEDHEVYTLISIEGWIANVKVTRLHEAPWVWADARVGPYPDEPGSMSRAAKVQASFMNWIAKYGRMKRVPPIN